MSDAKVIKDFLKAAPGLIESLKKPMADLHYAIRELQSVTDDYEDLPPDIQEFLDYAENAVNQYLRANRAWDDCRDELEKMSKAPAVKGKTTPKTEPGTIEDFAKRVLSIAASIPKNKPDQGSYGSEKVFVWAIREKMGIDFPTFKARMLEAHQKRLIDMTRLDAPGFLDESVRKKADADEIKDLNSEFHFVNRSAPRR